MTIKCSIYFLHHYPLGRIGTYKFSNWNKEIVCLCWVKSLGIWPKGVKIIRQMNQKAQSNWYSSSFYNNNTIFLATICRRKGCSLSKALILASINPKYDERLLLNYEFSTCCLHQIDLNFSLIRPKQSCVELTYSQCKFAIECWAIFWLNLRVNK